jgi:GR25 family glycosyltransferase involved in LPS biosynthesis
MKIDKAYCVTLEKRPEKWERFIKAYNQTGLDWPMEKFNAVDGSLFSDEYIQNSPYKIRGRKLEKCKGHHACALSHARIHEDAKAKGYKYIAVFEDDCWFKDFENIVEDINTCIAELPEDWKVLMIGGKPYKLNKDWPKYENFSENLVIARQIFETHAYIAKVDAVSDTLINLWAELGYDADAALVYEQKKGGYFLSNPVLCSQKPGFSDILHTDAAYHGLQKYMVKEKLITTDETVVKRKKLF